MGPVVWGGGVDAEYSVGQQQKLLRKRVGEGRTERCLPTKLFALTLGPPASFVREKTEAPVGPKLHRCGAL